MRNFGMVMRTAFLSRSVVIIIAWLDLTWCAVLASWRIPVLITVLLVVQISLSYANDEPTNSFYWFGFWFTVYIFLLSFLVLPFAMVSLMWRDARVLRAYSACTGPAQALELNKVLWKRIWPGYLFGDYGGR
jgi:hypothetical protein